MKNASTTSKLIIAGVVLTVVSTVNVVWGHEWMAPEEAANIMNPVNRCLNLPLNGITAYIKLSFHLMH